MPNDFHFSQRVVVNSEKSFYNGCVGLITSSTWIGNKPVYFVRNLCRMDAEAYFEKSELTPR